MHNLQPHTQLSLLSDKWGQCLVTAAAAAAIGTSAGSPESISTVNQLYTSTQGNHLNTPPVVSDSSDTPTDSNVETTINIPPQSIVVGGEAPGTGNTLQFWEGNVSNQDLPVVRWKSVGRGPLDSVEWEPMIGRGPLDNDGIEWETMVGRGPLDAVGIEWETVGQFADDMDWEAYNMNNIDQPL